MLVLQTLLNVLPVVGYAVTVYCTVIKEDDSYVELLATQLTVFYGNVSVQLIGNRCVFVAYDNKPLAIGIRCFYNDNTFLFNILYTKAIYGQQLPNNYNRIVQKLPQGVFTAGIEGELIGDICVATAESVNDYYQEYFNIQNSVYSDTYLPQLEYKYNQTIGLLNNSTYPNQLFQLLATLNNVALNIYDLELFVSQYIYYRVGTSSAIYINDKENDLSGYWNIGINGETELSDTTILAPNDVTPKLQNLVWVVYSSSNFIEGFKNEIINLIIKISRADIGNVVAFSNIISPVFDGFITVNATYPADPRTIQNRCIEFTADHLFPLNIIGYTKE